MSTPENRVPYRPLPVFLDYLEACQVLDITDPRRERQRDLMQELRPQTHRFTLPSFPDTPTPSYRFSGIYTTLLRAEFDRDEELREHMAASRSVVQALTTEASRREIDRKVALAAEFAGTTIALNAVATAETYLRETARRLSVEGRIANPVLMNLFNVSETTAYRWRSMNLMPDNPDPTTLLLTTEAVLGACGWQRPDGLATDVPSSLPVRTIALDL